MEHKELFVSKVNLNEELQEKKIEHLEKEVKRQKMKVKMEKEKQEK